MRLIRTSADLARSISIRIALLAGGRDGNGDGDPPVHYYRRK